MFQRHFQFLRNGATFLIKAAALIVLLPLLFVSGWGEAQRAVKVRVAPIYPEIAKRLHVTGEVRVEATVSSEGKVTEVRTVSGNHMLVPAAEEAVRKWKFEPGNGESTVTVGVSFTLDQ